MKEESFPFWQAAAIAALGGQASIATGYSDQGLASSVDVAVRLADGLTEVMESKQQNFRPEEPEEARSTASLRANKKHGQAADDKKPLDA